MTTLKSHKGSLRGIPLLMVVDRKSPKPLYQQIYDAYRAKITRGDLRAGQYVASTRELARDLRVSRLPVLNAYSQLLAEGHFQSRAGSGTFVAQTIRGYSPSSDPRHKRTVAAPRLISARAHALPIFERPTWAERCATSLSAPQPNVIVPKASEETFRPVRPNE